MVEQNAARALAISDSRLRAGACAATLLTAPGQSAGEHGDPPPAHRRMTRRQAIPLDGRAVGEGEGTRLALSIVTLLAPEPVQASLPPVKTEPAAGAVVSLTTVPMA
jgi:hypothetical protein